MRALFSSLALHSMNSMTSGCSTLSDCILAARRVLPPLFTTAAIWSYTRMNESGPLGLPPPESFSRCERSVRKIGAGAGAELEQHGLAAGELHDVFHVVVHALNEARRALRIFVRIFRLLDDVSVSHPNASCTARR